MLDVDGVFIHLKTDFSTVEQELARRQAEAADAREAAAQAAQQPAGASVSGMLGLGGLVTDLVNNLKVNVSNVRITVVDEGVSLPGHSFSWGLLADTITYGTYLHPEQRRLVRTTSVTGLMLYWDTQGVLCRQPAAAVQGAMLMLHGAVDLTIVMEESTDAAAPSARLDVVAPRVSVCLSGGAHNQALAWSGLWGQYTAVTTPKPHPLDPPAQAMATRLSFASVKLAIDDSASDTQHPLLVQLRMSDLTVDTDAEKLTVEATAIALRLPHVLPVDIIAAATAAQPHAGLPQRGPSLATRLNAVSAATFSKHNTALPNRVVLARSGNSRHASSVTPALHPTANNSVAFSSSVLTPSPSKVVRLRGRTGDASTPSSGHRHDDHSALDDADVAGPGAGVGAGAGAAAGATSITAAAAGGALLATGTGFRFLGVFAGGQRRGRCGRRSRGGCCRRGRVLRVGRVVRLADLVAAFLAPAERKERFLPCASPRSSAGRRFAVHGVVVRHVGHV